jgi:murein DD-endopeptidase MepM/ murein hydrolase activator NlpD
MEKSGRKMALMVGSYLFLVGSLIYSLPIIKRGVTAALCRPTGIEYQFPFSLNWVSEGAGGRYDLVIKGEQYVSYLLIKEMSPAFEGLRLPTIIRSDDSGVYRTLLVADATIKSQMSGSYALLPKELVGTSSYEVLWPVDDADTKIIQAAGLPKGGSHLVQKGLLNAVDIYAAIGAKVVAVRSGTVVSVEGRFPDDGCFDKAEVGRRKDNHIAILHDDGAEAIYGHLQQNSVRVVVGQRVVMGEHIAAVGMSGGTPGPHLHLHVGGLTQVNYQTLPLTFLCADGSTVQPLFKGKVCPPSSFSN